MKSFIAACITFIKDVLQLYKVGIYEWFWAFAYLFVNRKSKVICNENILITGTGSGIGKDLAIKLAAMGNTIICIDINDEANKQTVREIVQSGGRAHGYCCNVAKHENVVELHEKTLADVGKVSYVFNVAGVVSGKLFRDLTPSDIKLTMDVNVLAVFWVTQTFLEDMRELGYGHVTTISSVAGLFGSIKLVDYSCSKFAVMGLVEALRFEIMAEKLPIEFTMVNPYFIKTGMFEGVVSKWPYFMPMLETGWVGDKIIEAVEQNRVIVVMPRIFYYLMLTKAFCPDRLSYHINKFSGTFDVMQYFKGRADTKEADSTEADSSEKSKDS